MKWFRRREFVKELRIKEKKLKQKRQNLNIFTDYELQKYFQKLCRIEKSNNQG